MPQIWYTHSNSECLDPCWFLSCLGNFWPSGGQNTWKGELVELTAIDTWGLSSIKIRSLPLKSFLDFFLNVLPSQLESWFIHWVGCTTYWVHVSLEWDPCDLHVLMRPFEKRTYYTCMPWQCPSVRPSVCPSVRPGFPDFSSTCFEISIWNLVYTFSKWHDMSSLSWITIGSLWPSLQPKVGKTHFLQSWPHKS